MKLLMTEDMEAAAQSYHIQGGDSKQLVGLVYACLLEHLRRDGHRRVDRVGDDVEDGLQDRV